MNDQWKIDLYDSLNSAVDTQDVIDIGLKAIKPLGFTFCTFKTRFSFPLTHQRSYALGSSEDKVHQKNAAGGYDKAPITTHCSKTTVPAIWTGKHEGAIFEKDPTLLEEFFGWGHRGGWAQSIAEGDGQFSMFLVDSTDIMSQSYLENDVNFHLEWITVAVHSTIGKLRNKSRDDIKLLEREKEILRWIGDGKTAWEISQIFQSSQNTIDLYIKSAMHKLNASNKTNAFIKAACLQLLI